MIEIRCPSCNKKLFDAVVIGGQIVILCPRCHLELSWPSPTPEVVAKPDTEQSAAKRAPAEPR